MKHLPKTHKITIHISIFSVLFIALIFVSVSCSVNSLMFCPPRTKNFPHVEQHMGTHNTLGYIYFPAKSDDMPVMLYCHGNAEDLSSVRFYLSYWHQKLGWGIFGYDYPGYGISSGKPTESSVCESVTDIYDMITRKFGIDKKRLVVMGMSIGSGPASYLASHRELGGLILKAPLASAAAVVLHFPLPLVDWFPNSSWISDVKCPVLVFHGNHDSIVPFDNGKRVFDNANEPKRFVEVKGADHCDIDQHLGEEYFRILQTFGSQVMQQSSK